MIRMKVGINNPHLEELHYILTNFATRTMPKTAKAMEEGANLIKGRWIDFANGKPLEGVNEPLKRPSGGYARSIHTNPVGQFEHEIYSDAKVADWIENGTDDLDMKKTHPYGPRSRVSKKGVPYLIVPLQWGTPGDEKNPRVGFKNVMPINVYNIVENFKKMRTLVDADSPKAKQTPNAQTPSKMVGRARYNKGYDRLSGNDFDGTVEQKTRMDGMVRTTDDTGKDRSAGYFTFRIISAKSPADSWKRKGMPARHVTRALVREMEKPIAEMVNAAFMEDISK